MTPTEDNAKGGVTYGRKTPIVNALAFLAACIMGVVFGACFCVLGIIDWLKGDKDGQE